MTSFHIRIDYLESVEIILAALRVYPNPDASIIADGIEKTLITTEDGVPTHIGGVAVSTPQHLTEALKPTTSQPPTKPNKYPALRAIKGGKYNKE